jgi:hypothetical protein
MITELSIALVLLAFIFGLIQLYRILLTIIPEPTEGVVEIAYMAEPSLDLNDVSVEFNPSRMVNILCDGKAIGHEEGYTCTGEDGTPLCDGSPYNILAFFDPPEGTLMIEDGESDYTCKGTSSSNTVCYPETFNIWRRSHVGTEGLTGCPVDQSMYAPHGRCYYSKSQSGEALDYANEYIRLNNWKCIVP